jgi:hypothetical protein
MQTGGIVARMIPRAEIVKPCLSGNARGGHKDGPPMKIVYWLLNARPVFLIHSLYQTPQPLHFST